jgi:hypothetical protein
VLNGASGDYLIDGEKGKVRTSKCAVKSNEQVFELPNRRSPELKDCGAKFFGVYMHNLNVL